MKEVQYEEHDKTSEETPIVNRFLVPLFVSQSNVCAAPPVD